MENAIRNDDPAKDRLTKIYALAYQIDNSCKRFIKEAMENNETRLTISVIEAQRNMAARDLCKRYVINK